jgi:phospholipid transport system substrate-binding protein
MPIRRFAITCALLAALVGWNAHPAGAQSADPGAATFIQSLGEEAVTIFAKAKVNHQEAVARFKTVLQRGFDVPYIGRWTLGRFWNQATPDQQREYLELFERLIIQTYSSRFQEYSGESLRINGTRSEGERDTLVQSTIMRPTGPPMNVEWRVRKTPGGFRIIDVGVEGVSMSLTQRQEFASVIQQNGGRIEGLIQALRQKVAQAG